MTGRSTLVALGAVLMAAASPPEPTIKERVTPAAATQRVVTCGFLKVHWRYDRTLQEDIIEVGDAAGVTDEQLACAADTSLSTIYYIYFAEALQRRYDAIYGRLERQHDTASARQWLAQRGMLDRLPQYTGDDAAFAEQLEEFCGDRAKGALHSEYGPHAVSPDWIRRELTPSNASLEAFKQNGEALYCLNRASAAAGFALGFIGNEAAPEK